MSEARDQITGGMNPRDIISNFNYVTTELHNLLYVSDRIKTEIQKESLKKEIFVFLVEGKNDKKIWSEFVQPYRTKIHFPRIPKRKKINKYHAGKDALKLVFERKNIDKNPENPFVIKIRNNQVIGIIDRDFELLQPLDSLSCPNFYHPEKFKNLFVTETNDIETFFLYYGGFSIYLSDFIKLSLHGMNNKIKVEEIFEKAIILGCAFKASQNIFKFNHIDNISINEFCRAMNQKIYTCELFKLIIKNEENCFMDESMIKEFVSKFNEGKKFISKKNFEDVLFQCRGHSLMQLLCCYVSDDVKKNIMWGSQDSQNYGKKPDDMLFNLIFEIFKKKNSIKDSRLYLSLLLWEQKVNGSHLKKS